MGFNSGFKGLMYSFNFYLPTSYTDNIFTTESFFFAIYVCHWDLRYKRKKTQRHFLSLYIHFPLPNFAPLLKPTACFPQTWRQSTSRFHHLLSRSQRHYLTVHKIKKP